MQKGTKKEKKQSEWANHIIARRDGYSVSLKYSQEAEEKKLIKFTTHAKRASKEHEFVMSLGEIAEIIIQNLNSEMLSMISADVTKVQMIQGNIPFHGVCDRDFAKGEEIIFEYPMWMPLDVAVAYEAYNIAKLGNEVVEIDASNIQKARESMTEKAKLFVSTAHAEAVAKPEEEQPNTETELVESPYVESA